MIPQPNPNPDPIDRELATVLPPVAAEALRTFATEIGATYSLGQVFTAGQSGAVVLAVLEGIAGCSVRQLILKLDQAHGEYRAHTAAVRQSATFAGLHLVTPAREPLPVGDGTRFTFMRIVGGGLSDFAALSALCPVPGPATPRQAQTDGEAYVVAASSIVRTVLADWTVNAQLVEMSVPEFLRRHLGDRPEQHPDLRQLARRSTIAVGGRRQRNPLEYVLDPSLTSGLRVRALLGRAHGDLHSDNIILPVRPTMDVDGYRLIDLSRYSADAPLTRDPIHLMLHTVARALPGLKAIEDGLIEVLCHPHSPLGPLLPGWLYRLITGVREAGESWAMMYGLGDLWRSQMLLSTLASGLIFYSRTTVAAEARPWFLRLADCAVRTYLAESGREPAELGPEQPGTDGWITGHWIGRLCASLPSLRRVAAGSSLSHELEALVAQARPGSDRSEELVALSRQLGEPGDRPPPDLLPRPDSGSNSYGCPFQLCPRREPRSPGGAPPLCHLRRSDTPMRRS